MAEQWSTEWREELRKDLEEVRAKMEQLFERMLQWFDEVISRGTSSVQDDSSADQSESSTKHMVSEMEGSSEGGEVSDSRTTDFFETKSKPELEASYETKVLGASDGKVLGAFDESKMFDQISNRMTSKTSLFRPWEGLFLNWVVFNLCCLSTQWCLQLGSRRV